MVCSSINKLTAKLGSGDGFAEGGIASGPSTGYLATLHGTELIIPMDDISAGTSNSTTGATYIVNDNEEVIELLKELISEMTESKTYNKKVNKILDKVTAGRNSFQTRAED